MGKTLLQSFTGNTETEENSSAAIDVDDTKALSVLIQEMKAQLDDAATDVIQPRPEVLERLLKQVLH